jgi:Holliday junction resolvase
MKHLNEISEQKIQTKIINRLTKEGWLCVKLIKTSKNGIPDLMCLKEGVTIFIEVKRPNGKLSELQKIRIKQLKDLGFNCKIWIDYETNFSTKI